MPHRVDDLSKHKNGIVISFSYGFGVLFSRVCISLMLLGILFCFAKLFAQ